MTTPAWTRAGVILAVRDVPTMTAYYRDILGFEVEATYEDPGYATLRLGGVRLSLAEQGHTADDLPSHTMTSQSDPAHPAVALVLEIEDIGVAVEHLRSHGAHFASDVFRPPWGGGRCFITDPEGNLVEIEQPAH